MIKVTVERRYGAVNVRSRVTATSIDRAMELAGEGASLVLPTEPDAFFQRGGAPEDVERLPDPGRPARTNT